MANIVLIAWNSCLVFGKVASVSFAGLKTRGLINFSLFKKIDQKILGLIEIHCIIFIVDYEHLNLKVPCCDECKVVPLNVSKKLEWHGTNQTTSITP